MNAPEMLVRLRTPQADGLVLRLKTLTPLYTGGIGQFGDQVHPSNLLGGIRHFSCLVANTLGVKDFASRLWGETGRAKAVALRVRCTGKNEWLSGQEGDTLNIKVAPLQSFGWGFNRGFSGDIEISLLRRNTTLPEPYWQILLLSLRIQTRRVMLGARDQWGMGVVSCQNLADLQPLPREELARQLAALFGPRRDPIAPNLLDACFVKLRIPQISPRTWEQKLAAGLQWRYNLRNRFRSAGEDAVRHWLFGYLARSDSNGGGFQVSGAYPVRVKQAQGNSEIRDEIRLWWLWEHDEPPREVQMLLKTKGQELQRRLISSFTDDVLVTQKQETESPIEWVYRLAGGSI